MGNCFGSSAHEDAVPPDERRRQAAEAAERRQQEAEGRGLQDPEAFKRKQLAKQKAEQQQQQTGGDPNLRWNVSWWACIERLSTLAFIMNLLHTFRNELPYTHSGLCVKSALSDIFW